MRKDFSDEIDDINMWFFKKNLLFHDGILHNGNLQMMHYFPNNQFVMLLTQARVNNLFTVWGRSTAFNVTIWVGWYGFRIYTVINL